jgi:hypothetical protein
MRRSLRPPSPPHARIVALHRQSRAQPEAACPKRPAHLPTLRFPTRRCRQGFGSHGLRKRSLSFLQLVHTRTCPSHLHAEIDDAQFTAGCSDHVLVAVDAAGPQGFLQHTLRLAKTVQTNERLAVFNP